LKPRVYPDFQQVLLPEQAVAVAVAAKALKPANTVAIQDRHISPELYLWMKKDGPR
jgi:hypothetical protein